MTADVKSIRDLIVQSLKFVQTVEEGADNELSRHYALGEKSALTYLLTVIDTQERVKNARKCKNVTYTPRARYVENRGNFAREARRCDYEKKDCLHFNGSCRGFGCFAGVWREKI